MKIKTLEIYNFKGIDELKLQLNGDNTVFYGTNGAGKSSVLRAICIIFSRLISKAIKNRFKIRALIGVEDIKFGTSQSKIKLSIQLDDELDEIVYSNTLIRKDKLRKHRGGELDEFSKLFNEKFIDDEEQGVPIFVNYGVHRVVLDVPLRIRKSHSFDRVSAYEKAVENKIDFRTFFEWFRNQEDYENEIKVTNDINYEDRALRSVKACVYEMLEGFSNLKVDRNPLRMVITKNNEKLEIGQLSDGEKCTIALVGDLARRLSIANPKLEDPLQGKGIVLIDEIELHMHPAWQRKIIPILFRLFPNVQFIITTHSPQVLGELDGSVNIFKINKKADKLNCEKINNFIGWDSNYILDVFMGAASINSNIKGEIELMYDYIIDNRLDEAKKILLMLEELTDSSHEDVVQGRILLERRMRKNEIHK